MTAPRTDPPTPDVLCPCWRRMPLSPDDRLAALPSAPDQRLREALKHAKYSNHQTHGAHLDHPGTCGGEFVVGNCMVRAALSEATTSPEATLDVSRLLEDEDGAPYPEAVQEIVREWQRQSYVAGYQTAQSDDLAARLRGPA